jgi:hypothetical protein
MNKQLSSTLLLLCRFGIQSINLNSGVFTNQKNSWHKPIVDYLNWGGKKNPTHPPTHPLTSTNYTISTNQEILQKLLCKKLSGCCFQWGCSREEIQFNLSWDLFSCSSLLGFHLLLLLISWDWFPFSVALISAAAKNHKSKIFFQAKAALVELSEIMVFFSS